MEVAAIGVMQKTPSPIIRVSYVLPSYSFRHEKGGVLWKKGRCSLQEIKRNVNFAAEKMKENQSWNKDGNAS